MGRARRRPLRAVQWQLVQPLMVQLAFRRPREMQIWIFQRSRLWFLLCQRLRHWPLLLPRWMSLLPPWLAPLLRRERGEVVSLERFALRALEAQSPPAATPGRLRVSLQVMPLWPVPPMFRTAPCPRADFQPRCRQAVRMNGYAQCSRLR